MPPISKFLTHVPTVWTGWVIARVVLALLIRANWSPRGDMLYYLAAATGNSDHATDLTEYPHAGTWPVDILVAITGFHPDIFYIAFITLCLLADALFLALLLRKHETHRQAFVGAWFWVFFGTAAGQILVMRLDIFPALAVAACLALVAARPGIASAFLALATTMKLWPGVLAAGLVGRANSLGSWKRLASFFASGLALCAVTIVTAGFDRLVSPLTYQGERGLQIESVPASLAMLHALRSPSEFEVGYAASKSFEIAGPGTDTAIAVSNACMVVTVLAALGWALFRFIAGRWAPSSTMVFFLSAALLLIAANKVFSPQYIVWVGPMIAVILREFPATALFVGANEDSDSLNHHHRHRRTRTGSGSGSGSFLSKVHLTYWLLVALAALALVAAALGTYIYPFHYEYLISKLGTLSGPVHALVFRNAIIVVMALVGLITLLITTVEEWRQWPRRHTADASARIVFPGASRRARS